MDKYQLMGMTASAPLFLPAAKSCPRVFWPDRNARLERQRVSDIAVYAFSNALSIATAFGFDILDLKPSGRVRQKGKGDAAPGLEGLSEESSSGGLETTLADLNPAAGVLHKTRGRQNLTMTEVQTEEGPSGSRKHHAAIDDLIHPVNAHGDG